MLRILWFGCLHGSTLSYHFLIFLWFICVNVFLCNIFIIIDALITSYVVIDEMSTITEFAYYVEFTLNYFLNSFSRCSCSNKALLVITFWHLVSINYIEAYLSTIGSSKFFINSFELIKMLIYFYSHLYFYSLAFVDVSLSAFIIIRSLCFILFYFWGRVRSCLCGVKK